jgi:hypothetical protein
MQKITIKNLAGVQTHGAEMEDPTAWIAECESLQAWGLPERPELDEMGQPTGVILPAEYTIEIEDITAQVAQEAINAEALAYLAATDWLIIREVDAGVPCPADIKVLRAEARAKIVR